MKLIRDSVHNYIPISNVEAKLLKRPEILRLHHILQNSTQYHTYPSNHTKRFSHSVGAMHVAGLLFHSLIINSKINYTNKIHQTLKEFLQKSDPNFLSGCENYLRKQYTDHHGISEFYSSYGWDIREAGLQGSDRSANILNNILFQAIRFAALVHDIGHPPYSHATEFALDDVSIEFEIDRSNTDPRYLINHNTNALRIKYKEVISRMTSEYPLYPVPKLHEMIGIVLIDKLYGEIYDSEPEINASEFLFFRACWAVALRILTAEQIPHYTSRDFADRLKVDEEGLLRNALPWYPLGNIISSPVDCDRLDYLRRDPYGSGVPELGSFDADRIINSALIVKPREKGSLADQSVDELLVVGFGRRSLSALADFHFDRMRQYRWLTNHHNVVRTDMALTRLIKLLYKIYTTQSSEKIYKYLCDTNFHYLWKWDNLDLIRYVDDSWLETILHWLQYKLCQAPNLSSEEHECLLFMDVIFNRRVERLAPLWKRVDDFKMFADGFYSVFKNNHSKALPSVSISKKFFAKGLQLKETDTTCFTNEMFEDWKKRKNIHTSAFSCLTEIEDYIFVNTHQRLYFVYKKVKAYEPVPITLEYKPNLDHDDVKYLDEMSSLVKQLDDIYSRELKLYCFQAVDYSNHIDLVKPDEIGRLAGEKVRSDLEAIYSSIT